ncbi:MAG TPA: hypothetical protein VIU12_22620 [Chryseolinea sp.]
MRKTILIPTDFTITPLLLLKHAAATSEEELDVIFLYCTSLPDSITELLFYSPKRILETAVTKEFSEACAVMQNKYPKKIHSIRFELFHGRSKDAFEIMTEMNEVDETFIARTSTTRLRKNNFDPTPLIRKSLGLVKEVDLESYEYIPEKDLLTGLFVSAV